MSRNAEDYGNSPEECARRARRLDQRIATMQNIQLLAGVVHNPQSSGLHPARREQEEEIPPLVLLQEALQQLIDYVKDGCPDDARYTCISEAEEALAQSMTPPRT